MLASMLEHESPLNRIAFSHFPGGKSQVIGNSTMERMVRRRLCLLNEYEETNEFKPDACDCLKNHSEQLRTFHVGNCKTKHGNTIRHDSLLGDIKRLLRSSGIPCGNSHANSLGKETSLHPDLEITFPDTSSADGTSGKPEAPG